MRRVGLAPEKNIPFRCEFNSSLKIWRTEPLQPRWLTSASPVALSVFSVRCARDSPRRPSPARRVAHLRPPAPAHLLLLRPRWARPRRPIFFFPGCGAPFPGGAAPYLAHRGLAARGWAARPAAGRAGRQGRRRGFYARGGGGARGTKEEEEKVKIQFGFSCRVPDAKVLERSFCGSSLD